MKEGRMLEPKKPGDDGTTPTDPTQQQQRELNPGETSPGTGDAGGDTGSDARSTTQQ